MRTVRITLEVGKCDEGNGIASLTIALATIESPARHWEWEPNGRGTAGVLADLETALLLAFHAAVEVTTSEQHSLF